MTVLVLCVRLLTLLLLTQLLLLLLLLPPLLLLLPCACVCRALFLSRHRPPGA